VNAEVLAIGDEITSGQLLDTNSQWLSQRLAELGVRVLYHTAVGDELEPCAAVFRQAIERADVVVATGGLGPTADDLTRQALAQAAGLPLVLVEEALEHIRSLFARRKRPMPQQNEVQALFPEGSRVIPNPHGTAPGIDMELPRPGRPPCRFFALPGVPAEMIEMWDGYVAGALRDRGAGRRIIVRRNLKCFGGGESQIEAMLPDLIRRGRTPTVGINASQTTIILRIAAEGASEAECAALIEPTAATIREHLGSLVYGEGDEELQDVVVRLLCEQGKTLATVEVGTAGTVADWLGCAPGAAACYRGGLVAPNSTALVQLLGISPELLARHTLVSSEAAQAMAAACRERFASDYALAVSGFPQPALEAAEPQPVFFALAGPDGIRVKQIPFALHPAILTVYCAKHTLNVVRLALSGIA
jgi:nicotinamide-nucleotide amidase